jgi:rubrerythrin
MIRFKSVRLGLLAIAVLLIAIGTLKSATNTRTSTLENMQAAFTGESNADVRYLAFASQADREGYGEVASLFRAAARAEAIHAANHANVITQIGATPSATIETPDVKSTRENLEAAIKGETYERDTIYPAFLKQARADGNKAAIRSLNFAKTAEQEHAKLYTAALQGLDRFKGSKAVAFLVCPKCGYTTRDANLEKCASCFTLREQFETVN